MQEKYTDSSNEIKKSPLQFREQQTTKVRDERIDAVKYWLIVLVIAGHVFSRKGFANSATCEVFEKWIYIFHMPLFIFISGFFSRKKDLKGFLSSIWKILEPLIIFHVLIRVIPHIISNGTDNLLKIVLTPWWVLWYLLSLIYWRIMIQLIPDKFLDHTRPVVIITFCISILAGFLPFDRFLSIQRTLAFMPFFFLGYYLRSKNLFLPNKYKPFCVIFLVAMFAIPIFFPYLGSLRHADPYLDVFEAVNRMIVFVLAFLMSIAFINVCYNTPWIARQGRMTMQYYIYHALMILPIMAIVGRLDIPMTFVTAFIVTIVIIIGIDTVLKIPYTQLLTNPSLFIKKRKNKEEYGQ